MPTVALETPGADEADLRAALGALVGMELIAQATLGADAASVDIELPAGYSQFRLMMSDWRLDASGSQAALIGAYSQDGGTTWLDDYAGAWTSHRIKRAGSTAFDDAAFTFNDTSGGAVHPISFDMTLNPGSAIGLATIESIAVHAVSGGAYDLVERWVGVCTINTGRANRLRFLNFTSSGASTPDNGTILAGATYHLYGVPTP
jgi:hypothetical protein